MTIPFNMLYKAGISMRKKVALGAVFSLTVFVTIIAIVRVTVITQVTYEQSWMFLWSMIEQTVGAYCPTHIAQFEPRITH